MFKKCELSPEQKQMMQVARTTFMVSCPFFAHYFYSEMHDYPTRDVQTAATDGRNYFYNPDYLATLKDGERVFATAHEVIHAVMRHPTRCNGYRQDGTIRGLPYDHKFMNVCMDYVINALLMEQEVGTFNPSWLYHKDVTGQHLAEDVYERLYKRPPPPGGKPPGNQPGPGGTGSPGSPSSGDSRSQPSGGNQPGGNSTFGKSGKSHKGAKPDPTAQANGGGFDEILEPPRDPVTGEVDLPSETAFKEAIARAAAAAKAMGKMPAEFQRIVDELLAPKVDWREHVRMVLTGHLGLSRETWNTPNRRRIVLNPQIYMPGKRGFGAHTVVVAIDTSGSIGQRELDAFFAEVGGVLQDVRPKRVVLIDCDAEVHQVREARSLDEFQGMRAQGAKGGGGTDFQPVFEHVMKEDLRPDTLIYLTDMMGTFPDKAPGYPVVWCATTGIDAPWGEVVRINLD